MNLKSFIRDIPDFPSKGIVYKDITPLLKDASAMQLATESMLQLIDGQVVDKVVSMESRGFLFGPLLAGRLNAGFIPIRKPGKLPAEKISCSYDLEYGTDTLEIHKDAIREGDRILVHDDVLATGGTAKAACELVEGLGGNIVQCNFLIELEFLRGREKLDGFDIRALLVY